MVAKALYTDDDEITLKMNRLRTRAEYNRNLPNGHPDKKSPKEFKLWYDKEYNSIHRKRLNEYRKTYRIKSPPYVDPVWDKETLDFAKSQIEDYYRLMLQYNQMESYHEN